MNNNEKNNEDELGHPWYGGARALRTFGIDENYIVVKIYMTERERSSLREYARLSGKSMSMYVRDKIFYSSTNLDANSLRELQSDIRVLVRQVRGEATNINQIAYWANANKSFPEEADSVAHDLRDRANKLARLIERLERLV